MPAPTEPTVVPPGSFEATHHYYERVRNAQIHPLVRFFVKLGNDRIAERYCHLHPEVKPDAVRALLTSIPAYFRWGGADLFVTSNERGVRRIVVVETNSCPSGQKSMPLLDESDELGGYRTLVRKAFLDHLKPRSLPDGDLAVLYDKNHMEASGYAAALADLSGERVHLVPYHIDDMDRTARCSDQGVMEVHAEGKSWRPLRAAIRYVTQRPWTRIPPLTRTAVLNPVLACLAGGRNKLMAAKAYDLLNGHLAGTGLRIHAPQTIWGVGRAEVPMWLDRLGGVGVVKNPYSNAGQGVYTITSPSELAAFMETEQRYDRFIVQALVGNSGWSSHGSSGRLFHVGTVPNRHGQIFAADLRCMIVAGPAGFQPVAIYARRARVPLQRQPVAGVDSWDMLGTNLSIKLDGGGWSSDTERLLLMDSRDFNRVGVGLDDLVEGYLQTVLSVVAIDEMAKQLVTKSRKFRRRMFASLNSDRSLSDEIMPG